MSGQAVADEVAGSGKNLDRLSERSFRGKEGLEGGDSIETPTSGTASPYVGDPADIKRLTRRLDLRVIPPLFALFMLSFLDRSNIGNARIQGLEASLGMTGQDYSIALFVFFITYILCEVPSNLILKRIAPSTWLSIIVTAWGFVTLGQGLVKSFGGLVALRVVLGIFEAGLFPGGAYLMSAYYARYELQWRFSLFVSATIVAGAFGGAFAYGLAKMDGLGGYEGWRWIFIIEGILTVIVGMIAKFWVVDWPQTTKFLSVEEKALLERKLAADSGGASSARMDRLDKRAWRRILLDWKIHVGILMHIGVVNSAYSMAFFLPTVIRQMGYSSAEAQIRVIPVYLVATVVSLTTAWATDRFKCRYFFIMLLSVPGIAGYGILLGGTKVPNGGRYAACFLVTSSAMTVLPTVLAWVNYQVSGHYKRAIGTAMIIGLGNSGGFIGSNIWLQTEAPTYVTGVAVSMALMIFCCFCSTIYFFGIRAENRKRDRGGRDYRYTQEADELDNMGDDHPSWRYTY